MKKMFLIIIFLLLIGFCSMKTFADPHPVPIGDGTCSSTIQFEIVVKE